jgi:DeoR family fructose operon transcriptional repressor
MRHTVLGGTLRRAGGCFVGPFTVSSLAEFTVNIAFIGFTTADLAEAQVKRAVIDRARLTVVPMDRSKLGAPTSPKSATSAK